MLECSRLKKSYHGKYVVNDLSFSVKEGEIFAFLGSNGAGKTTTIKMILGLISQDSGAIHVKDNISIGYSPETPFFPPFLTGYEALEYYAKVQKLPKEGRSEMLEGLLNQVGLEKNKTKVKHYSKGMLQRLALAQALLGNPELLILDEPTAGLDAMGRVEMIQLIGSLRKQGKTILINSHILNDIEKVCDRGIIIKKGEKVATWEKESSEKTLEELFVETIGGIES